MIGEGAIAKIIGVVSGAVLAVVLDPPQNRMGFVRRTAAAFVVGFVFGHVVLAFVGWDATWENVIAAWCLASFGSWSAAGRIKGWIESYRKE